MTKREKQSKERDDHGKSEAQAQYESICEMVERLENDEDGAKEAIKNDPLSVLVRSDWHTAEAGYERKHGNGLKPAEFEILLGTGGPACRIMGELDDHQEPYRAWMEYQDWGTPWTQLFGPKQEILLTYCRQFYFDE